jgi:hypothetical protein
MYCKAREDLIMKMHPLFGLVRPCTFPASVVNQYDHRDSGLKEEHGGFRKDIRW